MSEETTVEAPPETPSPEPADPNPTETVEFWKQKAREQEKRAKDNAAAAKRLAEIEEAQKTETEKAADRMRTLETERDQAVQEALRFKVAAKFGIGDDDVDLFLTGTDEETLTKQAERLSQRTSDRKKQGNVVPREGTPPREPVDDEMRAFTRQLFDSARST